MFFKLIPSLKKNIGSFKNLRRNNVKLHDNVLHLIQEKEEEKKERRLHMELLVEIRDQLKILVFII